MLNGRNRMRKRTIIKILLDKVILILSAIILLIAIVGAWFLLEDYLHLSNEWIMFVLNCLVYVLLTIYIAFTMTFKRFKKTVGSFIILLIIMGAIVTGAFLIFYLRILPLPRFAYPYTIGDTILSTITILIFEYYLELTKSFK